jgi:hypothetical protein
MFITLSALAQDARYIDQGLPAYYDGYLFTISKTKEVRKELIEKDQLKLFNKTLNENIQIQNEVIIHQKEQVQLLSKQNEKLAKQIDNDRSMSSFEKVVWFGLGVAAAGFAVYGAKQIVK